MSTTCFVYGINYAQNSIFHDLRGAGSVEWLNETPLKLAKTNSQRSEPNWRFKYLIAPNFCAKFQPNRLTTTFGPWNTFSDNDT